MTTDDQPIDNLPVVLPDDVPREDRELRLARLRTRSLGYAFGSIIGLVVIIALIVAISNIVERGDNAARLDKLTDQLQAARSEIDADNTQEQERGQCERKFTANTRTTAADVQAGIARLIIIITTVVPEERPQAVGDAVSQLSMALDHYLAAVDAVNAWQPLPVGEQLPCPI